jgi:hypothetical protein
LAAFYESDWSVYRIKNIPPEAIRCIPAYGLDFRLHKSIDKNIYCLQAAPADNLGRLLNMATVDGILDHFNTFIDPVGGNYFMQGTRYLISGYFRFGSSGAPYLLQSIWPGRFCVNAIQSEACPLQLVIQGNSEGNLQYVNALASPIRNIQKDLCEVIVNHK